MVAGMRAGSPVVPQRPAAIVTSMRALGVVLSFRQAAAQPRAPLKGGVEGVQCVGADFAGLDVAEDRPDDPPDVALVSDPGACSELGYLKVDVEDPAEESVAFGGLVPLGLPQQAAERDGSRRLVGTCLPETAFLPGDRVGPA